MAKYTKEEIVAHRRAWVDALRSGKYTQGKGSLKTEDGNYCCLGVACEISGLGQFEIATLEHGVTALLFMPAGMDSLLPIEVMEWLGTDKSVGACFKVEDEEEICRSLDAFNDFKHYTFEQIADLIEPYIEADVIGV